MSHFADITKNFNIEVDKLSENCEEKSFSSEINIIKSKIDNSFFNILIGEVISRKVACSFFEEPDTCIVELKEFLYKTLLDREKKLINPIITKFSILCEDLKQADHISLCFKELEYLHLMTSSKLDLDLSFIKDYKGVATIEFIEKFERYLYEECYEDKDQKYSNLEKTYYADIFLIGFSDHAKVISGMIDYIYAQESE